MRIQRDMSIRMGMLIVLASTPVATESQTVTELAVAEHLSAIGAQYYGSWTCPACKRQSELFGSEALDKLPYVECNKPEEKPTEARMCRNANLRVFPTWDFPDGTRLEGIQSLDRLKKTSGLK